jgi:hypothetical protein
MATGADKIIQYDPPGAIGLYDASATFLLRFPEADETTRPRDATGVCEDFDVVGDSGVTMPTLVDGVTGRARGFGGVASGLTANDRESGATLHTRDMSVQVILSLDGASMISATGAIVSRGGTGAIPFTSQYTSFALVLEVIDVSPVQIATFQWWWQDSSGLVKIQAGFDVAIPAGKFVMLTATRRWISPTRVRLRYYTGDQLLGEVESSDGNISGGTVGHMRIGYMDLGGGAESFLGGRINEIMMCDRELTLQEIEATWLRITRYQPRGERLFRELHDKGFPITNDPGSDAQREMRMVGQTLGFAAALAEELRANFLPGRAYGSTLDDWVEALRPSAQPGSDIDTLRSRCLARLRQRQGVSIPGIKDALEVLLGEGTVDDLEFLAFSNTIVEPFDELNVLRWDITPQASWLEDTGVAASVPGPNTYTFDGTTQNWFHARMSVGGDAREARLLAKVAITLTQVNLEVGLYFGQAASHDYLLLGLRNDAGTYKIVTESFINRVSQGVVVQEALGGNPANLWLHLYQTAVQGTWKAAWSEASATSGYTTSSDITHPTVAHWAGMYMRTIGPIAAARVTVDDLILRAPYGSRPFNAYVLLDEALGFTPDIPGAQAVVTIIRHAFTHGTFIVSRNLLCDHIDSRCDTGPMGAL